MKSLWRRIGKKSLKLARRSAENGVNGTLPNCDVVSPAPSSEEPIKEEQLEDTEGEESLHVESRQLSPVLDTPAPQRTSPTMENASSQATASFEKAISGDEEPEEGPPEEEALATLIAPATSEENIYSEDSCSYCYGSQFAFHGGLYGYPLSVQHRRPAAVPVIKGYTMTDVDFPLFFSSYDIPVVSASRHASFMRRHRLVRLHDRYTSMPTMGAGRSVPRASTLPSADSGTLQRAPIGEVETEEGGAA